MSDKELGKYNIELHKSVSSAVIFKFIKDGEYKFGVPAEDWNKCISEINSAIEKLTKEVIKHNK